MRMPRIASGLVRIGTAIVVLLAVLALQPASAQEEPEGLMIAGSGVGLRGARYLPPSEPLPSRLPAVVAAVIENPNRSFAAEGVSVRLSIYDVHDQIVSSATFEVPQILPSERRGLAEDIRIEQDRLPVSRVETEIVGITRWVPVRPVPLLEVRDVQAYPTFHGDLIGGGAIALPFAAGNLINPIDAALGEVSLVAVVYDSAGQIAGGSIRRIPYVAPSATRPVGTGTLIYGTDIESRTLTGTSWGHVEILAAYPWIDLTPYRR